MSALKKILITLAVLAAIVALVPVLIPYDRYKGDIEQAMSARLGTDAQIGSIAFSYSPKPQIVLQGLTLGRAGEGTVDQIIVPLTLKNLLNLRKELTDVVLEKAQFTEAFARSLPSRLKPNPNGKDIHFAALRLERLMIKLDKETVGPLSGVLRFNPDGTFKLVTVTDTDGRANLTVKPDGDAFDLDFDAKNWVLPGAYPDIRFDQLIVRGKASKEGVVVDDVNGMIFGSVVIGQGQLTWTDGWRLIGKLQTRSMQADPLISVFSANSRSTGRMAASGDFEFTGDSYETLFDQRRIDINFTISDGNLHNFDLIAPLKSQSPVMQQRGGQTRFDTLRGDFNLNNDVVTLKNLLLDAGKFTATSSLQIDADKKLKGRINAKLASGAIVVGAQLAVEGTLDAPALRSAGAYKPGGRESTTSIF
ncbi:AsmA-like C-terminal region-containing protein [Chitinimonas sp. BJYL2]|uniref:AsmA-like C-terminal region-containing protein n=1 Tax=Chitinimonas sp. BJYL2 TaxID=2976696 RepID=UPI0022B34ABF|nr:AsmA-like C-terminal region-containing protein [Chitinimonas sp. BJYL2]